MPHRTHMASIIVVCIAIWFTHGIAPHSACAQAVPPATRDASSPLDLRLLDQQLDDLDARVKLQLDALHRQIADNMSKAESKVFQEQLGRLQDKLDLSISSAKSSLDLTRGLLVDRMDRIAWASDTIVVVITGVLTFFGYRTITNWIRTQIGEMTQQEVAKWAGRLEEEAQKAVEKFLRELHTLADQQLTDVATRAQQRLLELEALHGTYEERLHELVAQFESQSPDRPLKPEAKRALEEAQRIVETKEASAYTAAEWLVQGVVAVDNKEWDEAISRFSKAIEHNPAWARAYVSRAHAFDGLRRYEEALADCTKAIELDPTRAAAYQNRAEAQIFIGKAEQALDSARNCLFAPLPRPPTLRRR